MSVINDPELDGIELFVCDDTLIRKGADAAVTGWIAPVLMPMVADLCRFA